MSEIAVNPLESRKTPFKALSSESKACTPTLPKKPLEGVLGGFSGFSAENALVIDLAANDENAANAALESIPVFGAALSNESLSRLREQTAALHKFTEEYAVQARRRERYELQETAHTLLWQNPVLDEAGQPVANRFTACMKVVAPHLGAASLQFNPESGRARFGGVVRCENASCPVCAGMAAEQRRAQLQTAIEAAYQQGYAVAHVTYTLRHQRGAAFADTLNLFRAAQRRMRRSRAFRALKARYGWIESVRALEVTHTENAGWHPHRHEVVLLRHDLAGDELADFEHDLWRLWAGNLEALGGDCDRVHGLHVAVGDDAAARLAEYVAKFDKLPSDDNPRFQDNGRGGLAAEATMSHLKRSRSERGRTPLQLLADCRAGDRRSGRLWLEYFRAIKGVHLFDGLADFCAALDIDLEQVQQATDELAADELAAYEHVLSMPQKVFSWVCIRGARARLLELVEHTGGDVVAAYEFIVGCLPVRSEEPPSRVAAATWHELEMWINGQCPEIGENDHERCLADDRHGAPVHG